MAFVFALPKQEAYPRSRLRVGEGASGRAIHHAAGDKPAVAAHGGMGLPQAGACVRGPLRGADGASHGLRGAGLRHGLASLFTELPRRGILRSSGHVHSDVSGG